MAKTRSEIQMDLDSQITEHFNLKEDVQKFLGKTIKELNEKINQNDNLKFFVKGGTALNLLDPENATKWSDWDTQLIINPNLSPNDWYQEYSKIDLLLNNFITEKQKEWESVWTKYIFWGVGQNSFTLTSNNASYHLKLSGQQNVVNTTVNTIIHPKQLFDNVNALSQNQEKPDNYFDDIFPYHRLEIDEETSNKSSKTITTSIEDFYLYRMVVKYELIDVTSGGNKVWSWPKDKDYPSIPITPETDSDEDIPFNCIELASVNNGSVSFFILTNEGNKYIGDSKAKKVKYNVTAQIEINISSEDNDYTLMLDDQNRLIARKNSNAQPLMVNNKIFIFKDPNNNEIMLTQKNGEIQTSNGPLRAELIDISIPRRESIEAFHQWGDHVEIKTSTHNTNDNLKDIPIPDWRYHSNENVLMILEILNNKSSSPHKAYKRVERGLNATKQMCLIDQVNNDIRAQISGLIKNIYGEDVEGKLNGLDKNWKKALLSWCLVSIEKDYKISVNDTKKNELIAKIHPDIVFRLFDDIKVMINGEEKPIAGKDGNPLPDEQKEFVQYIDFIKRAMESVSISIENPGKSNAKLATDIDNVLLNRLSSIFQILRQNNVIASLDPVFSMITKIGKWGNMKKMIYPYIKIIYNPKTKLKFITHLSNIALIIIDYESNNVILDNINNNLNTLFEEWQDIAIERDQENLIIKLGFITIIVEPVSYLYFQFLTQNDYENIGNLPVLKHKCLIKELNKTLNKANNSQTLEWLGDLRREYLKYLTTF